MTGETAPDLAIEVEVQIAPEFAGLVVVDTIQAAATNALRLEGLGGEVTIVITDDQGIQELNRDFLGRDRPTDVLSFSAREGDASFVSAPEVIDYWGDVIVSYPRASEQAAEQGHSVERELKLLVVHGVLHLLGYDHEEEEDRAEMWARQDEILDVVAAA
ncbi:MAG: rRNA maturation RNase YbeY [Anaerolineae bacterium]|nr:rRNA maturation RNase YbeY [Anaerolineae bacterium]